MPHLVTFTAKQAEQKGRDLVRLIETDIVDRQPALEQRNRIRNMYYGLRQRKLRYKGQSNIHLHVLAEKIEGLVPKEMNAYWGVEPHANAKRVPIEYDEEETAAVERHTNWAVENDIPNFYQTFESWIRNRHIDGVAVVKAWYNYEERNAVLIEEAGTRWKKGEIDLTGQPVPEDRAKVPAEIIAELFSKVEYVEVSVDPTQEQEVLEGLTFSINFVEDRIEYFGIPVEFHASKFVDTIKIYIFRPVPVKDNVEVDLLEFEDLIVPYRTKDLQTAPRITQQYWLTIAELEQKIRFENWNLTPEDLQFLKNRSTAERQEEEPSSKKLQAQKDIITGQRHGLRSGRKVKLPAPYVDDKILIFEVYVKEDLEGTGMFEEMVYQIPYSLDKIVRAQYLEELFPHGRRPFSVLHSIPISNRFYSWSLGQILAPINMEVNIILNSVNDAQELINNPFFFYVPVAMPGDPKKMENIVPGQGIPVQDTQGIFFPKFQQEPLANLSTMDSLLLFADRLTISPQSVGSSQVRNAPRTARGTLALLSEAGAKIDAFITAAQKGGWSELMYQIYALYEEFGSEEKWEKVTGRVKARKTRSKDLYSKIKFVFKGNSVNSNKEVSRSIAQLRYSILAAEPMYATDPIARRELIRDFLNHFSEGIDPEKLLPRLPTGMGSSRGPMTQEAEIQIMLQGVPVDVLPIDDDAQHLQKMDIFQGSKRFESLDQAQVTLLATHTLQHQNQMLVKQQQGQSSAGGTAANNQPTGPVQDLNALEGGIK